MRRLLIISHSQSGRTAALTAAVREGAATEIELEVISKRAFDTGLEDLLNCQGVLIGTPENFGYMSGAVKDFFDRTYYPAEGKTIGLPYALFISAGNDGTGAVRQIDRIAIGYGWRKIAEPLIIRGDPAPADLDRCRELGAAFAAGLVLGIF
ncbi:MAG: NAD(P)H-dependent oxidoreductase [Proteobacteria bacterium]|nr:NAD(P)H-dependent oxidoreductase [Pseudomonadota bacterium]HQR02667.1 NAD(P)H-dependent oxidoreductase [Rhodocyclaceae bacterium]